MELYVHIPFCMRKCRYCDFLSFASDEKTQERYVNALCGELSRYLKLSEKGRRKAFSTCFIGGGTPSILPAGLMEKLLKAIADAGVSGEFTIECNPGTLDPEKLKVFKEYGVNRLSLGLQSTNDETLRILGRIHNYVDFFRSYDLARQYGFDNINIDLMSGLPGQNLSDWENDLKTVSKLAPAHISAYSLILEEGTPFFEIFVQGNNIVNAPALPDEATEREMYYMTGQVLREYGYKRYEISNYARDGYECRHNLGYWTGEEYTGIGIGASSYVSLKNEAPDDDMAQFMRYKNTSDINRYMECIEKEDFELLYGARSDIEKLKKQDLVKEYIVLHLRLSKGISDKDFKEKFGFDIRDRYGAVIDKYKEVGLLKCTEGKIRLTEAGFDVSNTVMADFM